jgi:hypothetical protein
MDDDWCSMILIDIEWWQVKMVDDDGLLDYDWC